jgi:hypothetical protein
VPVLCIYIYIYIYMGRTVSKGQYVNITFRSPHHRLHRVQWLEYGAPPELATTEHTAVGCDSGDYLKDIARHLELR